MAAFSFLHSSYLFDGGALQRGSGDGRRLFRIQNLFSMLLLLLLLRFFEGILNAKLCSKVSLQLTYTHDQNFDDI